MNDNIGILDPEGLKLNPLTQKPYSYKYRELAKIWSKLPAYKEANNIIEAIKENQVLLTVFETGAGKTVLVPKFALHSLNYDANIAITLPKRIIAKSAAEYAALTLDVDIGDEVGYQYKGSPPEAKSSKTKLLYATDGTIVARLLRDPKLTEFAMVIIDEAHEMKVQIAFLLYLLRETLRLRPEFKIIIMSATINSELFSDYFRDFKFAKIEVKGVRSYPIESIFLKESLTYNQILEKGFDTLIKILKEDDPTTKLAHDIIFFVTSANETFKICSQLNDYVQEEKKHICDISCKGNNYCIEVYAGISADKQDLAQDREKYKELSVSKDNPRKNIRKIVIATNVAESSLTIDGLKYVIDTGYELKGSYDPVLHGRKLDRQLISQAQAKQRMGRTGRTEPGICYHMYTENEFNNTMIKFPESEIRVSDITMECLKLLSIESIKSVEKLINIFTYFIEPPKEEFIRSAIETLIAINAISNETINDYGLLLNEIPIDDIFLANTFIFAKLYNCSREVMKIATLIMACRGNMTDLYTVPSYENKELTQKFRKAKAKFTHRSGDHLTLLNIFNSLKKNKDKINDFAYKNFFKIGTIGKVLNDYKKTKDRTRQIRINREDLDKYNLKFFDQILTLPIEDRVLSCFIMGFPLNTAMRHDSTYHTKFYKGDNLKINRISTLLESKSNKKKGKPLMPKNVVFYELFISMDQMNLSIVSKIPKKIMEMFT
ncbi:MAG: HrpA-like RNA helicase [Barrevirus sp.]|uniref:HrpA-like RNA helicase n=1 Tax=Barrevirus sp. TaxID=2487763 RepID=A0A3G4ZUA5_9VIRU|nr:MAG: HrpA-like RNA helicase [Barrevirus sp.]